MLSSNILKFACEDLSCAMRSGSMLVTDTYSGNIEIKYDQNTGRFSFTKFNSSETIRENLNYKESVDFLATLYVVDHV